MLIICGKEVFTTLEELVNPRHTALLLIDLQNDYIKPGGYVDKLAQDRSDLKKIIPPIQNILEAARHSGVLVVHIQMTLYSNFLADSPASLRVLMLRTGYKRGDPLEKLPTRCIEGTWGWQIVDELTPLPNEIVIKKHRSSAFIGTDLDTLLRSNGIKSVSIVGLVAHGCVIATASHALFYEYYPVLLRDCIGSSLPRLHEAAFCLMSEEWDVVDSKEVLKIWR